MKYYIKTLRSNLDNILSSESISPYSFYQSRGYGYQRLDRLKDDTDERLLKIDKKILNGEGESVIYIEIDKDDAQFSEVIVPESSESFYINKPFYLYPWNCRILFKNYEDANDSSFICRSSLTNKMWNYFQTGIVEKRECFSESATMAEKSLVVHIGDIGADGRRNRLKGFLFAYYWGLFKSLSPELARLLQSELRIYGLASALAGMRYPSSEMFSEIDRQKKIFNQYDPNRAVLKRRWEEDVLNKFSLETDKQLFDSLIIRFGVKKMVMDAFAAEQGVIVSPRLDTANMTGMNWKLFASQIESYTQWQIGEYVDGKQLEAEQKVTVGKDGFIQFPNDSLYARVVNEIIRGDGWFTLDNLSSNRIHVASELTLFIKAYYEKGGYRWDGSREQAYLDAMRKNIANSDPFDPNQIANPELRALAVFVLKGDMIDEMLKYMQITAVEEYGLVMGLWGASVGYVNIPKTFMQKSPLSQKRVNDCYNYTYSSLTGMENTIELNPDSFINGFEQQKKANASSNEFMGPIQSLLQLSQSPLRLTAGQISLIGEILKRNNGMVAENGFKQISQIKGIGKKKLSQIRQVLKPYVVTETTDILFKEEVELSKIEFTPSEVVRIVSGCLPDDDKVRKQVENDVLWYLNNENGPQERIIPDLCVYLKRNKSSSGKRLWVRKLYEDVDADLIEKRLREAYL